VDALYQHHPQTINLNPVQISIPPRYLLPAVVDLGHRAITAIATALVALQDLRRRFQVESTHPQPHQHLPPVATYHV